MNSLPLTIRIEDFNLVAKKPNLLKLLRSLTLHPGSGMNHELRSLEKLVKIRKVQCKVITAHHNKEMVGWALLSREPSDFYFMRSPNGFDPRNGALFQVYVNPLYRRKGIGGTLLKTARRRAGSSKLCICPWDDDSNNFYSKFEHYKHVKL